ncbi:MAG: family 10 glycosylhydrolase, partial [Bacteroidales bacterium]|nr:family 10 glycosylhydrolase [Bacteroidales bacterium]
MKTIKFIASYAVILLTSFILFLNASCSGDDGPNYEFPDTIPTENSKKPRYIWIDAAANFNDFANSKENIARDLTLAKDAGFTDIVVDIRPTNGDILFQSSVAGVQQVEWLGAWVNGNYSKVYRTATWDYLQAFIDKGHELGLKVHAGFNTMVGGNGSTLGNQGILYRDNTKKSWATCDNLSTGITNAMDQGSGTKFFNPANDDVQTYICNILKDLAKYDIDGIILDRGRFGGIQSDFSETTRQKFQNYLGGVTIQN